MDRLIAATAAAGGNEEAAKELARLAEEDAKRAAKLAAAPAKKSADPAALKRLGDDVAKGASTMSANEIVDVLRDYADRGVEPPPKVIAALSDAVAKNVAPSASSRNVADLLKAFSEAGVAPSPAAREALNDAVTREAPRMTPKSISEVLQAYADAKEKVGGGDPPAAAARALAEAVAREAPAMDPEEIAEVRRCASCQLALV